jgi:hypothetical protein
MSFVKNDELRRIWEDTVAAYLKVLLHHLPGLIKVNESHQSGLLFSGSRLEAWTS